MSALVVDASVAAAWLLPDESHPVAESVFKYLENHTIIVPAIWSFELGNILLVSERRGRITPPQLQQAVSLLRLLPLEVDHDGDVLSVIALGHKTGLTYYDAAYLDLAIRKAIPLATLDKSLVKAAKDANRLFES